MDKRLILSVAGSGKTSKLIELVQKNKRYLFITYTKSNRDNIIEKLVKEYNKVPDNCTVCTLFSFLFNMCIRPYLKRKLGLRGIDYDEPYDKFASKNQKSFYLSSAGNIYHRRICKLINDEEIKESEGIKIFIEKRLKLYFDYILIDEVQDFSSHDFNFLLEICKFNINTILVGDFYQHVYKSSSDGNTRKNIYTDINKYILEFEKVGVKIEQSNKSYRCSANICDFIRGNLNINIFSDKKGTKSENQIQFVDKSDEIIEIMENDDIIKLFLSDSSQYDVSSKNWGDSKGDDHHSSVAIILNKKTYNKYCNKDLHNLDYTIRNKLYVGITRSRQNVYLIEEDRLMKYRNDKTTNLIQPLLFE